MVADSGKEIQTVDDCLIEKKFNSLEENSCREPLSRLGAAFDICHEATSTRHQFYRTLRISAINPLVTVRVIFQMHSRTDENTIHFGVIWYEWSFEERLASKGKKNGGEKSVLVALGTRFVPPWWPTNFAWPGNPESRSAACSNRKEEQIPSGV